MSHKRRYPLAVLLLLLAVLIGVTLRQVHQAQLNRNLLTTLVDDGNAHEEDPTRYELKALAALKAGADPNCWASLDASGKIEPITWRDWLPLIRWPYGGKKYKNQLHRSALEISVIDDNDLKLIKALLDRGADVRASEKPALLGYAVLRGNEEMLDLLLDHGADVNERQTGLSGPVLSNITPLMLAAIYDPDMVGLLIRRGAKVNLRTEEGKTELDLALQYGDLSDHDTVRMIQILKAAGAKK